MQLSEMRQSRLRCQVLDLAANRQRPEFPRSKSSTLRVSHLCFMWPALPWPAVSSCKSLHHWCSSRARPLLSQWLRNHCLPHLCFGCLASQHDQQNRMPAYLRTAFFSPVETRYRCAMLTTSNMRGLTASRSVHRAAEGIEKEVLTARSR